MSKQITHIRKPNASSNVEHITDVKGVNNNGKFELTVPQVIIRLKQRERFYVKVGRDEIDVTYQTSAAGREYIKTKPDQTLNDNLLSLPHF
jgi:hypothetical protein